MSSGRDCVRRAAFPQSGAVDGSTAVGCALVFVPLPLAVAFHLFLSPAWALDQVALAVGVAAFGAGGLLACRGPTVRRGASRPISSGRCRGGLSSRTSSGPTSAAFEGGSRDERHAFVLVLTCGAALLALWIIARFVNFGPRSVAGALVHVAAAFVLLTFLLPFAMAAIGASGVPAVAYVKLFGVASRCSSMPS